VHCAVGSNMAALLVQQFSNLTITDDTKTECISNDKEACPMISTRMKPSHDFKCVVKSSVEAEISVVVDKINRPTWYSEEPILFVKRLSHNIKAFGSYSDTEVCVMYGETASGKSRSHWGLILQQEKYWAMDEGGQNEHHDKCILFHHMGDGVEIAVGCIVCLRNRVRNAYGSSVQSPKLTCFDFGRSSAAVGRFLSNTALGRNVGYEYNSKYRHGEMYYEWRTTNCCRLVFDLLFYIKLEYSIAVRFTKIYTGNEHWDDVFQTITEEYPEFTGKILGFYLRLKTNQELKKVATLIDGQYKLDKAFTKFCEKQNVKCVIL